MKEKTALADRLSTTVVYMRKLSRFTEDDFKIKPGCIPIAMNIGPTLAGRALIDIYQLVIDTYWECAPASWDPNAHKHEWDAAVGWLIREKDMDRANELYAQYSESSNIIVRGKFISAVNVISVSRNTLCHAYGLSSGIDVKEATHLTCASIALLYEKLCQALQVELTDSSKDFVKYYLLLLRRCARRC